MLQSSWPGYRCIYSSYKTWSVEIYSPELTLMPDKADELLVMQEIRPIRNFEAVAAFDSGARRLGAAESGGARAFGGVSLPLSQDASVN
jgi:hypothetical protein